MPTPTHCPYCALQCAQTLHRVPDAVPPVRVEARDFPTNRGGMCQKGWSSAEVLTRAGPAHDAARPARWAPGARDVGRGPRPRRTHGSPASSSEHGRDAVAVFGGGGLTNEKAYTLGKFARVVLRTPFIDYNGRFCMSSAAAGANRTLGVDRGLAFPLADLGGADAVLVVGSNPAATMPPLVQHLAGARARGGLVVVDPRRSATARLTEDGAGTHLAAGARAPTSSCSSP